MRWLLQSPRRAVGIEDGRLVAPEGPFELVVELGDVEIRPGLINAHDHLHRNHYGRLGKPPYVSAYAWARDIQRRERARIALGQRVPRRAALLSGAWKNLFAGVTTVVHHDRWEAEFARDFPIRIARIAHADSLGMSREIVAPAEERFALHVAEGIDDTAAREVGELAERGLLDNRLIAVHAVGVDGLAAERLRAAGAAIVWCPSSNLFLFGRTAPAELLAHGVDVLLGSDSLLTAAGDLLDELNVARSLALITDARLEAAVGEVAARRLGLAQPVIEPGAPADLVVLAVPLRDARARDVVLTIVAGEPRVARPDFAAALEPHFGGGRLHRVGAVERWTPARFHRPPAPPATARHHHHTLSPTS